MPSQAVYAGSHSADPSCQRQQTSRHLPYVRATPTGGYGRTVRVPVSYTHLDVYKRQWPASSKKIQALSQDIVTNAGSRPLGAYYRVNHKDLVAMHTAITETGVLYASANVHTCLLYTSHGW